MQFFRIAYLLQNLLHFFGIDACSVILDSNTLQRMRTQTVKNRLVRQLDQDLPIFGLRLFDGVRRIFYKLFQSLRWIPTNMRQYLKNAWSGVKCYFSDKPPPATVSRNYLNLPLIEERRFIHLLFGFFEGNIPGKALPAVFYN